jgi:hypothetical protein
MPNEKIEKKREKPAFDWHEWKTQTYHEPKDILRAFKEFNIRDKQIVRIDVVGFAEEYDVQYAARCAQHNAGVPYEVIDNGGFAYSNQTLVPCSMEINEPIILMNKDGSTLELQAKNDNSLRAYP